MRVNEREIREGITDGIYAWIAEHPITMQDIIELSIKTAMKSWLSENESEIFALLEKKMDAESTAPPAPPSTSDTSDKA